MSCGKAESLTKASSLEEKRMVKGSCTTPGPAEHTSASGCRIAGTASALSSTSRLAPVAWQSGKEAK